MVTRSMPASLATDEFATSRRSLSAMANSFSPSQLVAIDQEFFTAPAEDGGFRLADDARRRAGEHPQDFVADVVAVSVINFFKIVDIDKNHAERPTVAFQFVQSGAEGDVRKAPVADAGQPVDERLAFQVGDPVLERDFERIVAESLDAADNIIVFITQRLHPHINRHAVAAFMLHEDMRFAGDGILHRRRQRAAADTKTGAFIIDVHQDIIRTAPPDNFFGRVAGHFRRRFVPVSNHPVAVDEIDTVADFVQQTFIEIELFQLFPPRK